MIDNLASRWSREETEKLSKHINSTDYDMLCKLLPGRTKASIKAKQKRLLKEDPIPAKISRGIFKYYLDGESDGQILQRLMAAGYNYTLRDIAVSIKKAKQESEAIYAEEHNKKPTFDQLKQYVESRNG